jgi:predicted nucleic acid-binding Zn ribbon protein
MSSLFVDGQRKRQCVVCGQSYRPRVPEQTVCGEWCRKERHKRRQRSARHYWAANGRPPVNDADVDLRFGRQWMQQR